MSTTQIVDNEESLNQLLAAMSDIHTIAGSLDIFQDTAQLDFYVHAPCIVPADPLRGTGPAVQFGVAAACGGIAKAKVMARCRVGSKLSAEIVFLAYSTPNPRGAYNHVDSMSTFAVLAETWIKSAREAHTMVGGRVGYLAVDPESEAQMFTGATCSYRGAQVC